MKQIVFGVALLCAWSKSAFSKSLADPAMHYQHYQNYPQQSEMSGFGMYGYGQYPNLGGYGPYSRHGNYRFYHSNPACQSLCPKNTWSCNKQGMCTIISRRACLLKVCPRFIPPTPSAVCEFSGDGTGGVLGEVMGKISLQQGVEGVHFKGEVSGLSQGLHQLKVTSHGDLNDECKASGELLDPQAEQEKNRDVGSMEVNEEGVGQVDIKKKMIWLSHYSEPSIMGKSILIFEGTGHSASRVGCCHIIKAQTEQSSESSESSESSRPTVHPTRPTVHPTRPTVHPTRPTVHPTRPTVHPTRPTAHPTRPTDSGSGWFIDGNTGPETNNHREVEDDHDDNSDNVLEASGDDNDNEDGGFEWNW